MEPERRRQIDRAEAAGYLPHIRALAMSATKPLWWWRESTVDYPVILHSATLCAIDTGETTICVTANHVYDEYLSHREKFNDIECQVGGVRVQLEKYIIDADAALDLVMFNLPPILLAGSGIAAHGARTWPPRNLQNSDVVVLGGYPGRFRQESAAEVSFSFVSLLARVAQSSDNHAAFQLNIADSYWPDGSGGIPERSELGGISGGPIFRYHPGPVEFLELAGFVYQANAEYELIRGRHASCISSSGHIIRDT